LKVSIPPQKEIIQQGQITKADAVQEEEKAMSFPQILFLGLHSEVKSISQGLL